MALARYSRGMGRGGHGDISLGPSCVRSALSEGQGALQLCCRDQGDIVDRHGGWLQRTRERRGGKALRHALRAESEGQALAGVNTTGRLLTNELSCAESSRLLFSVTTLDLLQQKKRASPSGQLNGINVFTVCASLAAAVCRLSEKAEKMQGYKLLSSIAL